MNALLLILFFIFILYMIAKGIGSIRKDLKEEAIKKAEAERKAKVEADKKLIADAQRLVAITELIKQAEQHGDEETHQLCADMKYNGELPYQKDDGTWSDMYVQELSFSLAGINFVSGIKKYVGGGDVKLIPEPKNEFDPNAIKVIAIDGTRIGYVPAKATERIREFTDNNFPYPGYVRISEEEDYAENRKYYTGIVVITRPIQNLSERTCENLY